MWIIYLLTILDSIKIPCCIAAGVTGIAFLFLTVGYYIEAAESYPNENTVNTLAAVRKRLLIVFSICLPLAILIPSSRTAAMIFTVGSTIDYVKNNEKIKELPDKAVLCLEKYLDEYLTEEKQ